MSPKHGAVTRRQVRSADTPAKRAQLLVSLRLWLHDIARAYPWPALEQSVREDIETLESAK